MNARMVRKAIAVACLTAGIGLVIEQGSAPRAEPLNVFGKAFGNNPRSAPKESKVKPVPNPQSPFYKGGGQGYVATPPAYPPTTPIAPAASPAPATYPAAAAPATTGQYPQGQAAQGQYQQGQYPQGQYAQGQVQPSAPAVAQPAPNGQPAAAGQPDSAAQVHDYVAEMYKRDGREIPQWDYQAMGYNPQPVYAQQGGTAPNAPKKPNFLQRWVPGFTKVFPVRSDQGQAPQARTQGQPSQGTPGQEPWRQQAAQPQYAQPQYGQTTPNYGQPQYDQPQYGQSPAAGQAASPQYVAQPQPNGIPALAQPGQAVTAQPAVPQTGASPGRGTPVFVPPPAVAARPGSSISAAPQLLPQPEIPGLTPPGQATGANPDGLAVPNPAGIAQQTPAPSNGQKLPVLDLQATEPKVAATKSKPLGDDLLLDEAGADAKEQGQLQLAPAAQPNSSPAITASTPPKASEAPLLADEPVAEKPKENPYTGRKLVVDERVAVILPNPAASLLDDEIDEDEKILVADASPGKTGVGGVEVPNPEEPRVADNSGTADSAPELKVPPADDRELTERPKLEARPALKGFKGFCPVTLRNSRKLVEAKLEFSSEIDGQSYQFATAEAKAEFDAAPERYIPAKGGLDVVQASGTTSIIEGSLDHAVWYRGRLYMFASEQTREQFVEAPTKYAIP